MIIQCPACNTSFSVSKEKFGTKNRKVKCSKCYFIWTANSQGKAIEVPPLYESINSQGGVIKENKNDHTKVIKFLDQSRVYRNTEETYLDKNFLSRNGDGYTV